MIKDAVNILKKGGVILFKTDTVWGLGCDATDLNAIQRIYKIKRRPQDKPLIILVDDLNMIKQYVEEIHPRIETLLSFHKRPLTIIYQNAKNLPDILTSRNNTIAIRITQSEENKQLISALGRPIVATSANYSGKAFPKIYDEISTSLKEKVDFLLQPDKDEEAEPSTMVKFTSKGELIFIRD